MAINRTKFHFDNLYHDEYHSAGPYGIYQVGDISCEPGYCVPPHCQVVNEISYIVSGNGIFSIDGKEYEVKKGTLFLNRKGEHHEIRSSKMNPLRYYYLGFIFTESMSKEEPVSKLKEFFENPTNRIVSNVSGIQEVFIKLFGELLTKDFLSANLIETYMHQILSYTYRSFSQKKWEYVKISDRMIR